MSPVIWISVTDRHPFVCLPALIVIQFETVHWPWNETRPRAAFFPRRFSAIHSYVPASSCWKLGISRTAFEFFILTLLGKGMPLVLLQLISGTGLQKRNKKFPWWQLSVAVITVWLSTEDNQLEQESCELLFLIHQTEIIEISGAHERTLISPSLSFHATVLALRLFDEFENE